MRKYFTIVISVYQMDVIAIVAVDVHSTGWTTAVHPHKPDTIVHSIL